MIKVQLYVPPGGYFAERWCQGLVHAAAGAPLYRGRAGERRDPRRDRPGQHPGAWLGGHRAKDRATTSPTSSASRSRPKTASRASSSSGWPNRPIPEALTVLGGPHASMAAEDCLEHIPELDVVVRGEGEFTMLDICRAWETEPSASPPSATSRGSSSGSTAGSGAIRRGRPSPTSTASPSPPSISCPSKNTISRSRSRAAATFPPSNIMTSRGCPFNCSFCATPINWGRHVRMRSPENVVRRDRVSQGALRHQGRLFLRRHVQRQPQAGRRHLRPA